MVAFLLVVIILFIILIILITITIAVRHRVVIAQQLILRASLLKQSVTALLAAHALLFLLLGP